MYILYFLLGSALSLYSYALVDPNITLLNHPLWTSFRNLMVQLGYYARFESAAIFALLLTALFGMHMLALGRHKTLRPVRLAILLGGLMLISYPLLSHDVFNYLFSAKVVTYYHSNPWIHPPQDFATDPWLRFMHWTHAPYPYGPTFLLFVLPAAFISGGKFLIAYALLKLQYLALYIWTVRKLATHKKEWAIYFATSPLILIEGLLNMHNDFVAVCLAIVGLLYVAEKRKVLSRVLLICSGGIKYTTAPFILYAKAKPYKQIVLVGIAVVMIYLIVFIPTRMQPWYFLTVFAFIPLCYEQLRRYAFFFTGILYMYVYYLAYGQWSDPLKYQVAAVSILATILYNYFHDRAQTTHS